MEKELVKDTEYRSPIKGDVRRFVNGLHDQCGKPDWRNQGEDSDGTCYCCAHCNLPGGH